MNRLNVAWRLGVAAALLAALGFMKSPGESRRDSTDTPLVFAQAPAPVAATLWGSTVTWSATPNTLVTAQLRSATGQNRGQGAGLAGATGAVTVTFGGGGGPGGGGGGGNNGVIRPTDLLVLTPQGGQAVTFTVPAFYIDVDPATDKVIGSAPAGTKVSLSLTDNTAPTTPKTGQATAAGDGSFSWSLSGQADINGGDIGEGVITTPDGDVYTARFAVLTTDITLGVNTLRGTATSGTQVQGQVPLAAGGVTNTQTATVLRGTAWTVNANQRAQIAAGGHVKITKMGGTLGLTQTLDVDLPTITIKLAQNQIIGSGPANADYTLEIIPLRGQTITRQGKTAADGSFTVDSTGLPIGAGSRISAVFAMSPEVTVRASVPVPGLRVAIFGNRVNGSVGYTGPVTLTLRGGDGKVKDTANALVGADGALDVTFSPDVVDDIHQILPGDAVEIERTDGDPQLLRVPPIKVLTDIAADTISGDTDPGTRVDVILPGQGGGGGGPGGGGGAQGPTLTTTSDANGHFSFSVGSQRDLVRGMNNSIILVSPAGNEFHTGWAATQLNLSLSNNNVAGNGASGRTATAKLTTSTGKVLGTATVRAGINGQSDNSNWNLALVNNANQAVTPQTGDVLEVTVGDDVTRLVMPELSAVSHIESNQITGQSLAGITVTLRVNHTSVAPGGGGPGGGGNNPNLRVVDELTDDKGIFDHDFTGDFDLQFNDALLLTIHPDDHNLTKTGVVPGLTVNINDAAVLGAVEPDIDIQVSLKNGNTTKATDRQRTSLNATFTARFRDQRGLPVLPLVGDEIIVSAPTAKEVKEIRMTMPELTMNYTRQPGAVSGRATAGGTLTINLAPGFLNITGGGPGGGGGGGGGMATLRPTISADGTYTANVPAGGGGGPGGGGGGQGVIRPGSTLNSTYRLSNGHRVLYGRGVPIMNVELGGSQVCGFGDTNDAANAAVQDANDATLASGSSVVGINLRYELGLADSAKKTFFTEAGQRVNGNVASEALTTTLPNVAVEVNWATGQVLGSGPTGTAWLLAAPASGCFGLVQQGGGFGPGGGGGLFQQRGQIGQSGRITQTVSFLGLDPGQGVQLAVQDVTFQRAYRQIYRSLGRVFVLTSRVGGIATPGLAVTAILKGSNGAEKGRGTAIADGTGNFDIMLKDGTGKAVDSKVGDMVTLEAGETPTIPVEMLNYDYNSDSGLVGNAPAMRDLRLEFTLRDGRVLTIPRTSDDRGRFSYLAADVPPRADWTMKDVTKVRAVLPTENLHEIVVESNVGGSVGPTPTPRPGGNRPFKAYVPHISKNARR